jgi:gluconolactonase
MFKPPEEIKTEVFARVPDALQRPGPRGGSFLEGPAFDRAGNLFVTDIAHGRIFRVSAAGDLAVAYEYDGIPNGIAIHRDGSLYITDRKNGIIRLDLARGTHTTILDRLPTAPFHGPNDLIFASNGDLYFTDQGDTGLHDPTGRLVRLRADGRVEILLAHVPSPNGLVLDKAERSIYLAVTRANAIWHVPLSANSQRVGRVGNFIQLTGGPGGGPDGLAMDAADNLAICHVRLGSVWLFSQVGEPLYRLRSVTGTATTNAAFGGADGKTLFITESATGTILTARLPEAGLPLFSHR